MTPRLRRGRRRAVVTAVVTLVAAIAPLVVAPMGATGAARVAFRRLAGPDRYATAAAIASDTFTTASGAIIATGETFPDALAASFVAGYFNAPILLTERNRVPAVTQNTLTKLGVKQVLLLGGEAAISKEVAQQLDALYELVRLPGADRFVTAANAAMLVNAGDIGELDGKRTVFLTNGYNYPDALAIGPLANAAKFPVILNGSGGLGTPARAVLQDDKLNIGHVILVGGDAVISPIVEQQIQALGITTSRLSGIDRFATAAAVADFAIAKLDFVDDHLNLARGIDPLDARQGFADALAGAVHAGRERAPLLLTDPTTLSAATRTWIDARAATLTDGDVLGGESAVSPAVVADAEGLAPPGFGTVTDVDPDGDAYTYVPDGSTDPVFVAYAVGDQFTIDGAPATLEAFEAALSRGDGIRFTATPRRHELVNR